jgi:hypothetical protein
MRAAATRRVFASRTRELRAPFLEPHGCDLLCIFLFFLQNEKHAVRGRNKKNRRGTPPGPSGAISVNTLFWKILVTRAE